jgi:hypothetical protein
MNLKMQNKTTNCWDLSHKTQQLFNLRMTIHIFLQTFYWVKNDSIQLKRCYSKFSLFFSSWNVQLLICSGWNFVFESISLSRFQHSLLGIERCRVRLKTYSINLNCDVILACPINYLTHLFGERSQECFSVITKMTILYF